MLKENCSVILEIRTKVEPPTQTEKIKQSFPEEVMSNLD